MSGHESRQLRQTSAADNDHHEEPSTTSRRPRGDGHDDDDDDAWCIRERVVVFDWWEEAGNFLEADDSLKMALFLIANNVLFGQPFDKKVTSWLFNLVDDLEAFNGFAWGHYVFKMTLHYLRHGFRSRNSKKGFGKVRYRLYGFPWAVEVWAMEVVDNLIDGFGMRLQDTLPRMRRWMMHKRQRNCVQTILDLGGSIHSENADVKEVLEATDDEAQADYWVGVDYNMTEGDDGNDGVIGDGDGDDGAATSQKALKRKAQKKKKKTSVKKKQRKAVPITRLDQDEDYTPGYTPTPHVDYTPGYTPTPLPPHPHMSSRQEPRSKRDDRITELLEAVRALSDVLDAVVKWEEIQSSRGESNQEAPVTIVRDPSLDREEVHTIVRDHEVVDPATEKVVGSSGLVSGDIRMGYNYAEEEDRSIRVRLRSAYCMSPFIDPTRASVNKLQQDKSKYDQFKKKAKAARRNVGTEESIDKSFFMELEDPTKWLSTDTKLNLALKKILETENEAESSFDALAFQFPQDWIEYGFGNRPGWGQPWWLYTQLCVPCCVGEPDGHWILCKVDLLDHQITIFDPTRAKTKSIQVQYFRQLMPLRREKPRGAMFTVSVSSNQMIPQ
ncbi:hypothetical protein Ddye_020168 [Dipteronia dyeriana]|uniref:Ubiquitin-like protease family profile domain-containing protein n=1 Tax=Dipteronia dyeriana TaxID=168575 RepID=A0AAD9WWA7_9ROSI|nr:hypothetical protein Ddye_020168 [Dipteronia dyeriana]